MVELGLRYQLVTMQQQIVLRSSYRPHTACKTTYFLSQKKERNNLFLPLRYVFLPPQARNIMIQKLSCYNKLTPAVLIHDIVDNLKSRLFCFLVQPVHTLFVFLLFIGQMYRKKILYEILVRNIFVAFERQLPSTASTRVGLQQKLNFPNTFQSNRKRYSDNSCRKQCTPQKNAGKDDGRLNSPFKFI